MGIIIYFVLDGLALFGTSLGYILYLFHPSLDIWSRMVFGCIHLVILEQRILVTRSSRDGRRKMNGWIDVLGKEGGNSRHLDTTGARG